MPKMNLTHGSNNVGTFEFVVTLEINVLSFYVDEFCIFKLMVLISHNYYYYYIGGYFCFKNYKFICFT